MGGTALSAFFTPRFVTWFGYTVTHVIIAVALVVVAASSCWSAMRDSPRVAAQHRPGRPRSCVAAAKLPVTWQMSFLYAVAFGGFVAFSTYLPTYLKDVYAFDLTQAGTRTAGLRHRRGDRPAGRRRPVRPGRSARRGGHRRSPAPRSWRSWSRSSPRPRCRPAWRSWCSPRSSASAPAACSPGSPRWHRAERVGSVTGIVGAAGGLGGFFPPLVMGATYDEADHSYTIGLILLCVTAVVALLFTPFGIRKRATT